MIRKLGHIAISMLLLILTLGFTVSKHYCGDELVAVSVFSNDAGGCGASSSCDMDAGCCHNEHQVVQLNEEYTPTTIFNHVPFYQIDLVVFDTGLMISEPVLSVNMEYFSEAESPPPLEISSVLSNLQVYRL